MEVSVEAPPVGGRQSARGSLGGHAVSPPRRNHNHIWQVLMYARRVFYKIDTASALNPEAAVLYVPLGRFR